MGSMTAFAGEEIADRGINSVLKDELFRPTNLLVGYTPG